MTDELQDMNLSEHALRIGDVVYFTFLQDLDGDILVSQFMST